MVKLTHMVFDLQYFNAHGAKGVINHTIFSSYMLARRSTGFSPSILRTWPATPSPARLTRPMAAFEIRRS